MQDRVPLYPGRVKMTPVAGQANTYDMVRADDPTQAGTPLNKATFLKDATAALYGLGTGAVPDDVLAALGKYKQYWWRRRDNGHYVLKETSVESPRTVYMSYSSVVTYTYGSSVTINQTDGTVTIDNPQTLTTKNAPNASVFDPLIGSYYICDKTMQSPTTSAEVMLANTLYFIPDGTTITNNGEDYYLATAAMKISTEKTTHGEWEYLQSSNRNAYPDSGEVPVSSVWVEHRENNSDTLLEYNQSYSYATEISIDQATGEVSLVSPQTTTATNASSEMSFIKSKAPCYLKTSYDPSKIYYVPAGATSGTSYTYTLQGNGFPVQFGSSGNPHGMVVTAVQKTISYEYEYLGIPFDNAVTAPKIETGSYVGTGTYGASNPSQITFEFAPSWVIMLYVDGRYPNQLHLTDYGAASFLPMDAITTTYANTQAPSVQGYAANATYAKKSEDGKILYWYNTNSARSQLNAASDKLFYIAFS